MAGHKLAHANSHLEKQIRFPTSCRTLYTPYRRGKLSKMISLSRPSSPRPSSHMKDVLFPTRKTTLTTDALFR